MRRLIARSALVRPALARLLALAVLASVPACSSDEEPAAGPSPEPSGASGSGLGGAGSAQAGASGEAGSASNAGSGGSAMAQGGSSSAAAAGASAIGGASNGGGAGLVSALCPESALFCDDFEDDALAAPPGTPWRMSVNEGSSIAVDEMQAFSGSKAAHVNATLGASYRRGYMALDQGSSANIFPAAAREMYGRAMMYLAAIPGASSHWTFIQGEGRSADDTHNALYRFGGQHQNGAQLMANYETTDISTDCWDHSASVMPAGSWTCVEWRFAGETNEMQFWLEGTELADIHVTQQGEGCVGNALEGQWIAPPAFQTLYLGWEHYQPTAVPIDLWVDDVVVATERVGCPAAQ